MCVMIDKATHGDKDTHTHTEKNVNRKIDYPMARHFSDYQHASDCLRRREAVELRLNLCSGEGTEYRNPTQENVPGFIKLMGWCELALNDVREFSEMCVACMCFSFWVVVIMLLSCGYFSMCVISTDDISSHLMLIHASITLLV